MKLYIVLFQVTFFFFSGYALSTDSTRLSENINYSPTYSIDPEAVIINSLQYNSWKVKESLPNKLIVWLDDYNDHELVVEIEYSDFQISLKKLSFKKLRCNGCSPVSGYLDSWVFELRQNIARNFHQQAIEYFLEEEQVHKLSVGIPYTGHVKAAHAVVEHELSDSEIRFVILQAALMVQKSGFLKIRWLVEEDGEDYLVLRWDHSGESILAKVEFNEKFFQLKYDGASEGYQCINNVDGICYRNKNKKYYSYMKRLRQNIINLLPSKKS